MTGRICLNSSFFVQVFLSHHAENEFFACFFSTMVGSLCAACTIIGYPYAILKFISHRSFFVEEKSNCFTLKFDFSLSMYLSSVHFLC